MSPEGARASHSDLDFVAHEERSGLVAEGASGLEEGGRSGANSSFSLEGFKHDGSESAFSVRGLFGSCVEEDVGRALDSFQFCV